MEQKPTKCIFEFFPKLIGEGKVRKIYASADDKYVLLEATDNISVNDSVLEGIIAKEKGILLTQISKRFFELTKHLVPNAVVNPEEIFNPNGKFNLYIPANCIVMKKLKMFKSELITRNVFTGSITKDYFNGIRTFCDETLPDGLVLSQKFDRAIFTPTDKAPQGEHDKRIDFNQLVEIIKNDGMGGEAEALFLKAYAMRINQALFDICDKAGILFVDMKIEVGMDENGTILVGDEISPDSCRFTFKEDYVCGEKLKSSDKQIARNFYFDHPGETMPQEILDNLIDGYVRIAKAIGIDVEKFGFAA